MRVQSPSALREHWIVRVAREAGWPGAAALSITPDTPDESAWTAVMRACGVPERVLLEQVSVWFRIPLARWELSEVRATHLIPRTLAERHRVVPLREQGRALVVATADPTDLSAEQELAFVCGRPVRLELATPSSIRAALGHTNEPEPPPRPITARSTRVRELAAAPMSWNTDVTVEDATAPPVVRLLDQIISEGITRRASDIHMQSGRHEGVVRLRIDGVMHDFLALPPAVMTRVVSRIKVLGKMDIADRLRPQDGRARIVYRQRSIDLRLSTVPTRDSEKAVIRILDGHSTKRMEEIGLPVAELARIRALMQQRDGIVIVTGPTGSGKTTTLYGALAEIATGEVNVVTIEDPVEYDLSRITQIQIDTRRGVTFAGALRAVLRQDPDVILVGEVRDTETAVTAAHAALTGHLVLTTLHTNDALGVLPRLHDLGLEASTIADALRGIVAQRLLRRLCPQCRVSVTEPLLPDEARWAARSGVRPVYRSTGCAACAGTGYRGRLAVAEVLSVTEAMQGLLATRTPIAALAAQARADGMRPMFDVALDAVRAGDTTLEEVERVIGIADAALTVDQNINLPISIR
jgi:type II secretory ATPase GspE/PulE/Tfp pilus assembly ATPase PilB-like protein